MRDAQAAPEGLLPRKRAVSEEKRPGGKLSGIIWAMLYKNVTLKRHHVFRSLLELVIPVLLILLLILPRLFLPEISVGEERWASKDARALEEVFGLYGKVAESSVERFYAGTNALKIIQRQALRVPQLIRPFILHGRLYDGKLISYLPFLLYAGGTLGFSDSVEAPQGKKLGCAGLQGFFDYVLANLNPYVVSSFNSDWKARNPSSSAEFNEYFTALTSRSEQFVRSLLTKLEDQSPSSESQSGLRGTQLEETDLRHAVFKPLEEVGPDTASTVLLLAGDFLIKRHLLPPTQRVTLGLGNSFHNLTRVEKLINRLSRVNQLSAAFFCKRKPGALDGDFDVEIRMAQPRWNVVDTRQNDFPSLLLPGHDATFYAFQHLLGQLKPGERVRGSFLTYQMLLYTHIFNVTGARKIRELNVSEPVERVYGPKNRRCFKECVEKNLKREEYCNVSCQETMETIGKSFVSFRSSRAITRIMAGCARYPAGTRDFQQCNLAILQAGCVSCQNFLDQNEAFYDLFLALTLSNVSLATPGISLFTNLALRVMLLIPGDWSKASDSKMCLFTILNLAALHVPTRTQETTIGRNSTVHERWVVQLLGLFRAYLLDHSCSSIATAQLYQFTEDSKTENAQFVQISEVERYVRSTILGAFWLDAKTRPFVNSVLPFTWVESRMPQPSSLLKSLMVFWLQTKILALLLCMAQLIYAFAVLENLFRDKELQLHELLKCVGVPKTYQLVAGIPFHLMYSVLYSLVISLPMLALFQGVSPLLIFGLNFSFSIALLFFCLLIYCCFDSLLPGVLTGVTVYVFGCCIEYILWSNDLNTQRDILGFISFVSTYGHGIQIFQAATTTQFSDSDAGLLKINSFSVKFENKSLATIFLLLLAQAAIHGLLAVLIESLRNGDLVQLVSSLSSQAGRPPSPPPLDSQVAALETGKLHIPCNSEQPPLDPKFGPETSRPIIKISGLTKRYPVKNFVSRQRFFAVRDVSFEVLMGEIFVLLGHNGAGKSTILKMLIGSVKPTSGSVQILQQLSAGLVYVNPAKNRSAINYCPQFEILCEDLTVYEHLKFFGLIRGLAGDELRRRIAICSQTLKIDKMLWHKVKTLSAGYKKSLSLGIVLIEDTKSLILDEPTTGMDIRARETFYNVVRSLKKTHAIILTTHYLNEAENLGDRIAILTKGMLQCTGSVEYLKQTFGSGLRVRFLKPVEGASVAQLTNLFKQRLPESTVAEETVRDIAFDVPTRFFSRLLGVFKTITRRNPASYGVGQFTIENVLLEEVFYKFNQELSLSEPAAGSDQAALPAGSDQAALPAGLPARSTECGPQQSPEYVDSRREVEPRTASGNRALSRSRAWLDSFAHSCVGAWLVRFARLIWILLRKKCRIMLNMKNLFLGFVVLSSAVGLLLSWISYLSLNKEMETAYLDGRAYLEYPFKSLVPTPVAVGFSNQSADSAECGRLLKRFEQHASSFKPTIFNLVEVPPEVAPTPRQFENLLLRSSLGKKVQFRSGNELKELFAPGEEKFIGFFCDSSPLGNRSRAATNTEDFLEFLGLPAVVTHGKDLPLANVWIFHNPSHRDSLVTGVNLFASAILQSKVPGASIIQVANHPLQPVPHNSVLYVMMIIAISLSSVAQYSFSTQEVKSGLKQEQHESGVDIETYWIGTYLFDVVLSLIIFGIIGLSFWTVNKGDEINIDRTFWSMLTLLSLCLPSFFYVISFCTRNSFFGNLCYLTLTICGPIGLQILRFIKYKMNLEYPLASRMLEVIPTVLYLTGGLSDFEGKASLDNKTVRSAKGASMYRSAVKFLSVEIVAYLALTIALEYLSVIFRASSAVQKLRIRFWLVTYRAFQWFKRASFGQQDFCHPHSWRRPRSELQMSSHSGPLSSELVTCGSKRKEREEEEEEEEEEACSPPETGRSYVVRVRKLTRVQTNPFKHKRRAYIQNISLELQSGECYGLLGTNGAGKSMLLETLAGRRLPTSGTIEIPSEGTPGTPCCFNKGLLASLRGKKKPAFFSFCPQKDFLLDYLSGMDHLKLFTALAQLAKGKSENVIPKLVKNLDLQDIIHRQVKTYSGGNRKKLCLGIAYIRDPHVLLLDEPTNGIDPLNRKRIYNLLNEWITEKPERSVIVSSQIINESGSFCNRIAFMNQDRILLSGSSTHIKLQYGLYYLIHLAYSEPGVRNLEHAEEDTKNLDLCDVLQPGETTTIAGVAPFPFSDSVLDRFTSEGEIWKVQKRYGFENICNYFEVNKKAMRLKNFYVTDLSLEDVFRDALRNDFDKLLYKA